MISHTIQKNKYGGRTWSIKLDSLHHVFLHETDNHSFVVEFKEWKLFNYKTHFTFVSQEDLKGAIRETLERVFEFLKSKPKYSFSSDSKDKFMEDLFVFIDLHGLNNL